MISVEKYPGAMALTRTPFGASSSAMARVAWRDGRLRNRVGEIAFLHAEGKDRSDIDDCAAAGCDHAASCLLRSRDDGVEVDVEGLPPGLLAHAEEGLRFRDPGIVDEHRDGPELRLRIVEGLRDLSALYDVRNDRKRLSALGFDFDGERFEPLLTARDEHDTRAVFRKYPREAPAKAGGGAGDERHGAGKIEESGSCHTVSIGLRVRPSAHASERARRGSIGHYGSAR